VQQQKSGESQLASHMTSSQFVETSHGKFETTVLKRVIAKAQNPECKG
jgi:hypothetical protein